MDFEACLKVHSLISVHHKGIKLGPMIHLNVSIRLVESNYRLVKTSPSSLCKALKWRIDWRHSLREGSG